MEYKVVVVTSTQRSYTNDSGELVNYSSEDEITFTFTDCESASCFAETASKHVENFHKVYIYFNIEEF